MAREEIFFGVNIDTGQPIKKFGELKDRTKLLKKELDGLKVGSKRFNEIKKEITANQATIRRFNRELRQTKSLATRVGQGVTNAFKGAGLAIAGAFAVSQITKFASESIKLYDQQEKAVKKVEQAIKSTGKAAGLSLDELTKKASELQSKTIFGDEDILNNATAQLLTFTNITEENFLRTQEVALDLATVLDGDLKSASIQLGKALNDPVANLSALSRSGIQFSAEQKAVIKRLAETNRLAEAQGVILAELERQYGGQAQAAAKAGAGGLQQLSNTFGDMQEAIGKMLFGSGKLVGFLSDMVKGFTDLITPTNEGSQAIIKQRLELNTLASRLNQANQSQEDRVKIINQMNRVYPGFLKNLDAESASNEEIRDRLRDVNKELINKLTLQLQEEEVLEKAKDASELQLELYEKESKLASKLVSINEQFGYSVDLVSLSIEEQVELLRDRLDAESDIVRIEGEKQGIANQQLSQLQALNILSNDYLTTQRELADVEEELNKEQEKKQGIIDRLFGGEDPTSLETKVEDIGKKVASTFIGAVEDTFNEEFTDEDLIGLKLFDLDASASQAEAIFDFTDGVVDKQREKAQEQIELNRMIAQSEKDSANARLEAQSSLLQSTLTILSRDEQARKKNAALIKAIAISDIVVNTQRALLNAVETGSSPLSIDNLLTGGLASFAKISVQQVAILAQSAASIAAVSAQKFQRGGILQGASHANGGIPIMAGGGMVEAEGGEAIINKKSTAAFAPLLSAINSYGGNGDRFERGGLLGVPSTSPVGDTTNAQLLGALNNVNFRPTVSVVEINEAQTRISEINTSSQL